MLLPSPSTHIPCILVLSHTSQIGFVAPGITVPSPLPPCSRHSPRSPLAAKGSSGHRLFISAFMPASKVICDDKSLCVGPFHSLCPPPHSSSTFRNITFSDVLMVRSPASEGSGHWLFISAFIPAFTFSNVSRCAPLLLGVLLGTGYLFWLSCPPPRSSATTSRCASDHFIPMPSTALVFNVPQLLRLFTFSNVSRYAPLLLRFFWALVIYFSFHASLQDHLRRHLFEQVLVYRRSRHVRSPGDQPDGA